MKKQYLLDKVAAIKSDTKEALQLVYDSLNQGQQKQIVKERTVKELFDRYGVVYDKG